MEKSNKLFGFFVLMLVLFACVSTATSVAAANITELTDDITDLFIELIPLIVVLSVFTLILAVVRFRK